MNATREELERHWRKRVRDARIRLQFARSYLKELQQDLKSGAIPPPDGDFVYRRAIQADREALDDYARLLRIFTDLVVYGKPPIEKQKPSSGSEAGEAAV